MSTQRLEVKSSADGATVEEHDERYDGCVENNDDDTEPGGDAKPCLRRQSEVDREQREFREAIAQLVNRSCNVYVLWKVISPTRVICGAVGYRKNLRPSTSRIL